MSKPTGPTLHKPLHADDRFLRSMDNLMDAFAICTGIRDARGEVADLRIDFANLAAGELTGRPRESLVGRSLLELYPTLGGTEFWHLCIAALEHGIESRRTDVPFESPEQGDGPRYFDFLVAPLGNGLSTCWRDVTERHRVETSLRFSEQRFRALADSMPQLVWSALPDGRSDYYNHHVALFDGFEHREDGTWHWLSVLHPDDIDRTVTCWQDAIRRGRTYQVEHRLRLKGGGYRWHLSRGVPVRDTEGKITRWYGTATDIDDLKRTQSALQESDRRKDEFLAMLAHELRNPLAPIVHAVEILKLRAPLNPEQVAARDMIDRQVQHMVRLIDDLLDVGRITRGKLQLRREKVNLVHILGSVSDVFKEKCERAGNVFSSELPTGSVYVDADPVRLTQIFSNLLDNACKYTPRGGRVTLRAARDGLQAVVCVEDTGIGIPQESLKRIFDLFWQAQSQEQAEPGAPGLGIGLSLVRGLVAMHGGHIEARSAGAGKGSEFIVRLPCIPRAEVSGARGTAEAEVEQASAQRILTVDDNADAAESLSMLLRLHGHEVVTAHDGIEALEIAERFRPTLVLLDLGMPRLDGYEACRRMRQEAWGKTMLIVAVSGWGQESDRRKSKSAGFDEHLVKPVSATDLLELTRAPLEGRMPP